MSQDKNLSSEFKWPLEAGFAFRGHQEQKKCFGASSSLYICDWFYKDRKSYSIKSEYNFKPKEGRIFLAILKLSKCYNWPQGQCLDNTALVKLFCSILVPVFCIFVFIFLRHQGTFRIISATATMSVIKHLYISNQSWETWLCIAAYFNLNTWRKH